MSNIIVDTTQAATDTIDYVATDTWGNTATSTRTVIIEAANWVCQKEKPPLTVRGRRRLSCALH